MPPVPAPSAPGAKGLFAEHTDDYLLSLGLPPEWLPALRQLRSDSQLDRFLGPLPEEVQERLYQRPPH